MSEMKIMKRGSQRRGMRNMSRSKRGIRSKRRSRKRRKSWE